MEDKKVVKVEGVPMAMTKDQEKEFNKQKLKQEKEFSKIKELQKEMDRRYKSAKNGLLKSFAKEQINLDEFQNIIREIDFSVMNEWKEVKKEFETTKTDLPKKEYDVAFEKLSETFFNRTLNEVLESVRKREEEVKAKAEKVKDKK
jgi:hypothetical protein